MLPLQHSILKKDDHFPFFKKDNHISRQAWVKLRGEWPSGLYSLRQVTEVKLGRVRSDFGWVTTEA